MYVAPRRAPRDSAQVPRQAVGRVIGKKGATIQAIERESGARVKVVDGDAGSDAAEIRVQGDDEARARATEAVLEIVSRAKYPPPQRIDAMDTS